MKRKWLWAALLAVPGLAAYAGNVMATPPTVPGFSGTTLATAKFGPVFSHIHTVPAGWSELIQTKGESDLFVQQNTWDPALCGGCVPGTGWHTHPGPSFIIVTQGSVAVYEGDDPTCTPEVYTAGTENNAFIDEGGGHVHLIRNETGAVARTVAVQLIPAGASRREDAPAPEGCLP